MASVGRIAARVSVLTALVSVAVLGRAANLVTDESTRIEVLKAAFPDAKVSPPKNKPLDWRPLPWPKHELTDALRGEEEYTVVGTMDRFEQSWANICAEHGPNPVRRLRMRVYDVRWGQRKTYVALAQYVVFPEDSVARSRLLCAFARLFVLTRQVDEWRVDHTGDSLLWWGQAIPSFRLLDINGDGQEEVVVEAEGTTAHRRWITMTMFAVSDGRLHGIAEVETLSNIPDTFHVQYTLVLNVAKSRNAKGMAYYFTKTVYGTATKPLPNPRIKEVVITPLGS